MKVVIIIIAGFFLIPVVLLIFILLNPPNTLDKDCGYNAEEDSMNNATVEHPEDFKNPTKK